MLILAIVFFSLAIILGLFLLAYVLQNKETPKALAFIHGPLAAIGLILLIAYAYTSPHSSLYLTISIILFILAAFGGITLISIDLMGKPVPKWMALGHGITALTGFILLILSLI